MATVRYTNIEGQIAAESRGGSRRSYAADALGSTVALIASDQTASDAFSYWPFGGLKSRTGSTATAFRFVGARGYYAPQASALTYIRRRHYGTSGARWLTRDPASVYLNYVYASANPTSRLDPSGLIPILCCLAAAPTPKSTCEQIVDFINRFVKGLPNAEEHAEIPSDVCRFACLGAKSFDDCAVEIVNWTCGKAAGGLGPIKHYCDLLDKILPLLKQVCTQRQILNNPKALSDCIGNTRVVSRCSQCCQRLVGFDEDAFTACVAACRTYPGRRRN